MKKVYFVNNIGEKLVGVFHIPKKKTDKGIILVHGFKGNKDRKLILNLTKLLEKKYNVLRFDFSGNGESEGKFEDQSYSKYMEELKTAIEFFKEKGIKKICLIAHSLGTNISVLEQYKYKNIDQLILVTPAFYVKKYKITRSVYIQFFISLIKGHIKIKLFDPELKEKRELKLKNKYFFEILFNNPKRFLKNITIPTNVILAELDKAIHLEKSIKLCEKEKISYKIIKNAKHNFNDEESFNQLKNETLKFLENF